jgi:hypothetical protein
VCASRAAASRGRAIVVGIVLKRAEDLKNKTVVITQKTPVAVQGILIAQRITQPL